MCDLERGVNFYYLLIQDVRDRETKPEEEPQKPPKIGKVHKNIKMYQNHMKFKL